MVSQLCFWPGDPGATFSPSRQGSLIREPMPVVCPGRSAHAAAHL